MPDQSSPSTVTDERISPISGQWLGTPFGETKPAASATPQPRTENYSETESRIKNKPTYNTATIEWIEDEKTLRDEGVIYGLAKDDASAKEEAIISYFEERAIFYQAELDGLTQELIRQQEQQAEKQADLRAAKDRRDAIVLPKIPVHLVLSFLVRLILSAVGLLGLWWLIFFCTQNGPWDLTVAVPVSIGILVVGSLSLWQKFSKFHEEPSAPKTATDTNLPKWLSYVMEFAPAVAASVFAIALLYQNPAFNGLMLLATGLFLLVAFLMGTGKLLLGNLVKINMLRQQIRQRKAEQERVKEHVLNPLKQEIADIEKCIVEVEAQIKSTEQRIIVLTPNLTARRDALRKQAETTLKIFRSEFEAAKNNRRLMTSRQLAEIQQAYHQEY